MIGKTLLLTIVTAVIAALVSTFVMNLFGVPQSPAIAAGIGGAVGAGVSLNAGKKQPPKEPE